MDTTALPAPLACFEALYRRLDAATAAQMPEVYAADVLFRDPLHELHGLPALQGYTQALLGRVAECGFECTHWIVQGPQAAVQWRMRLRHPALRGGALLQLRGMSQLRFHERIDYHEDFYDLGAMVYEHVPVLGTLVRGVKQRLGRAA